MFSTKLVNLLSEQLANISESLTFLMPEFCLFALFIGVVLIDLIWRKLSSSFWSFAMLFGLGITLFFLLEQLGLIQLTGNKTLFLGMYRLDSLAIQFKIIFVLSGILTVLISVGTQFSETKESFKGEYFALINAIVLGLCFLAMSVNFLSVYISLELVSISSYILSIFYFNRKSAEGAIKYVLFGAFSSGLMLYGVSLLYGLTGTLDFSSKEFILAIAQFQSPVALWIFFLSIAALLFKISAIPFHFWTPDVYESAPTPVVALFSTAPKLGGIVVLFRLNEVFGQVDFQIKNFNFQWIDLLVVLSIISMLVGNFSALWQKDAKRMLAYSSIAHAGFLLIGVINLGALGVQSLIFYAIVYTFLNFGAFFLIDLLSVQHETSADKSFLIENYRGLGLRFPFWGIVFLICMIGLASLPPTAGFSAKLFLFSALWNSYGQTNQLGLLLLLVVGLLNTAVALVFYLKIPYYLFFKNETTFNENSKFNFKFYHKIILIGLLIPILLFFFKADWLMNWIQG